MEVKVLNYEYTRNMPLGCGVVEIDLMEHTLDFCHLSAILENAEREYEKEVQKLATLSKEKISNASGELIRKIELIIDDYIQSQNAAYIMLFEEDPKLRFTIQEEDEREITWVIANEEHLDLEDESKWGFLSINVVFNKQNAVLHVEFWSKHLDLSLKDMEDLFLSKNIPLVDMYETRNHHNPNKVFQIIVSGLDTLTGVFSILREAVASDEYECRSF